MTNLIVTGVLVIAFAVGLRRVLAEGRASRWAPRLIALYGISLVAARIFRPSALAASPSARRPPPRSAATGWFT